MELIQLKEIYFVNSGGTPVNGREILWKLRFFDLYDSLSPDVNLPTKAESTSIYLIAGVFSLGTCHTSKALSRALT